MLNHAAAVLELRALHTLILSTATLGLLLVAASASALEGIDLSSEPVPIAEGECPRLIKIKYPFLSCSQGQIGQSSTDETWANSRQIPIGSKFVEGDGYWGEDLNSN